MASFADLYLFKQRIYPDFINKKPHENLRISVVIPTFNEPDVISSLESIYKCKRPTSATEVILVINSPENACSEILNQNSQTLKNAQEWIYSHPDDLQQFHIIYKPDLPAKDAGVGLARKIGMDEAVARFNFLNRQDGLIAGFDADSSCDDNYLIEIEKQFNRYPKTTGCSVYFEHPVEGNHFPQNIYNRIVQYETYLRYYVNALRYAGFPFAYQTLGSSFVVKASVYCMQGGMNKKKAGEDFYFLQKIIPLGNYVELNSTRIIPSPRTSDRVPFGTGAAIQKLCDSPDDDYLTYHFKAFLQLKHLLEISKRFFKTDEFTYKSILNLLPNSDKDFFEKNDFWGNLIKINDNSPDQKIFNDRFYQWFNAFRVLKYLNFLHENDFTKVPIRITATELIHSIEPKTNIPASEKEMLYWFRKYDRAQKT
jgi:glycosyltransferase involved in cell wall biosynthesis